MTAPPYGRRHAGQEFDPLTDSAVHRLMLGTLVTLHLYGGTTVTVGLLAIRDVSTWEDLEERIVRGMPVEVMASRRRIFPGGSIMWAEVSTDPIEEPEIWQAETP